MQNVQQHLPSPDDEALFESLLIAYDEALARGEEPSFDESRVPARLLPRLRAALACVSLLARGHKARGSSPVTLPHSSGQPAQIALKTTIGRFELLREIGRGGHGVVFLAVDPRLRRLVALKVPRPEVLMTPDLHRRFLREGQTASGLSHPNLVPVFEVGDDGPLCYIAAAYCEGPSLAAWLKEHSTPLDWREAASLVVQLADATAHAHSRGVLHRDIKPANVLLSPAESGSPGDTPLVGQRVIPCLTDFGLARLIDEDAGDLTRTGTMLGTPSYMAPEQAAGRTDQIGPATDVYALGAVLYELLVGRPPFRGANDLETVRLVTGANLVAPSALRAHFPRDLEAICLKALAASPHDRYQTAAELAGDLRRFLDGKPTVARPLGPVGKLTRWTRRQPIAASLVTLLTLLAIVAPLAALRQSYLAQTASDARVEAQRSAACEADARKDAEQKAGQLRTVAQELRGHLYRAQMDLAHQAYRDGNMRKLLTLLESHRPARDEEDLRDFGWYHLWRRAHEHRFRIDGAPGDCALSDDGRWLAVAGVDGTRIGIFDVSTGARLRTFAERAGSLLAFRPHSSQLAYHDHAEKSLVLVDVATGKRLAALEGGALWGDFSPDGATLAVLSNGRIVLWNIDERRSTVTWEPPEKDVRQIRYSPDGALILTVAGSSRPIVRMWDSRTGSLRKSVDGPWDRFSRKVVATLDGSKVAYTTRRGFGVCDSERPKEELFEIERSGLVNALSFSPRGDLCASYSDGTIEVWSIADRRLIDLVKGHRGQVTAAQFSRDGTLWASKTIVPLNELLVFGSADPRGYQRLPGYDREILVSETAIDDRGVCATVGGEPDIRLWNARTGQLAGTLSATGAKAVAMRHDGKRLAVVHHDSSFAVWDLDKRAVHATWKWFTSPRKIAFSPDGAYLAAGAPGRTADADNIAIWDAENGTLVKTLRGHPMIFRTPAREVHHYDEKARGGITSLAFSPDGKTLATAAEWRIRLWNLDTGELMRELAEHQDHITGGLAFSPDGSLLVSCGADRFVKIWDVRGGELVETLSEAAIVHGVAFSPDGRLLAFGTSKGIRLWHAPTRDICGTLETGDSNINHLRFSADGGMLIAASADGGLHVWHAANDAAATRRKP